jgi:hypothetical protein
MFRSTHWLLFKKPSVVADILTLNEALSDTLRVLRSQGMRSVRKGPKLKAHWLDTAAFARPISDIFSSDGSGVVVAVRRFVRASNASSRTAKHANSSLRVLSSSARWSFIWFTMAVAYPLKRFVAEPRQPDRRAFRTRLQPFQGTLASPQL